MYKVLILIVIIIINFGRLALFRYTFNRCELLCNFIFTWLILNREIQFEGVFHFFSDPCRSYVNLSETILSTVAQSWRWSCHVADKRIKRNTKHFQLFLQHLNCSYIISSYLTIFFCFIHQAILAA